MFLPIGNIFLEFSISGSPRKVFYTIKSVAESVGKTQEELEAWLDLNNLSTSIVLSGIQSQIVMKWYLSLVYTQNANAYGIFSALLDQDLNSRANSIV